MLTLFKKNRGVLIGTGSFCLLLVILIWSSLQKQLRADRAETVNAAVQRNSNLAVALEQYAIRTIQNADAVIQIVKKEWSDHRTHDLSLLLRDSTVQNDLFTMVSITDSNGVVIGSTNPGALQMTVADRAYFGVHKRNAFAGLYLGKPIISRVFGRAAIPVSRRYNGPAGGFGGIIIVLIEPPTFTSFYAKANLHPDDIVSLVSLDGTTFARRTGNRESFGEDISKSPLYTHVKRKDVDSYFARDAIRGVPTFFSYRKIPAYGMIATVGTAEADVLADYHNRARKDTIGVAIICLLLLTFFALVASLLIISKRNEERVKTEEAKYRSFFESSLDAILITSPDGQIFAANPAACTHFGMSEAEIRAAGRTGLTDAADPNLHTLLRDRERTGKARGELTFRRKDGTTFTGEASSGVYYDAAGRERCTMMIRDITERKKLQQQLLDEQERHQLKVTEQVINAQEKERAVIGRELHDNVNQVLTTVKLYLEMALTDKNAREELLPKSIGHVMDSINEIRKLSRDLSAPTLGTRSLLDSINALLEVIRSSSGLRIAFRHHFYRGQLPMEQELALYRIVQEQLNNVIRHAQATKVLITLTASETTLQLTIKDNGIGFDTSVQRAGIGIDNIISRTRVFEGSAALESEPGNGCVLTITLPLSRTALA
jgi:PAS domain S-box-containing protein